jgi:hypothetical protein
MKDCAKVNTPIECGVKMSKNDEGGTINSTTLKTKPSWEFKILDMHSSKYSFWSRTCKKVYEDTYYNTFQNFEVNSLVYQRYY